MKRAEAKIYIDSTRPRKDGTCAIKLLVTFNRTRKYYHTGMYLTEKDYKKVVSGGRRNDFEKATASKFVEIVDKANKAIESIPYFTFEAFETAFNEDKVVRESVYSVFEHHIKQLEGEERLGTASSYRCALNSLAAFRKDLSFSDLSVDFLKLYEKWMIENGRSRTSVGIYLRNLRAICNQYGPTRDKSLFGIGRNQYSIPTGRNIKKAITHDEVKTLFKQKVLAGSSAERAKDYWFFLFLCNGMNVVDFCLLRWGNIDGDILRYTRSKTKRSKRANRPISVAIKPQTREIIKKWGNANKSPDNFIFPHFDATMDAETRRKKHQQLTKWINTHLKKIAIEAGISKQVTTYVGRHSFATILKRAGHREEVISELLGHGSVATTRNYLDSFEDELIQSTTDVLVEGLDN